MWDTPSPSEARSAPATPWQRGVDIAFVAWVAVLLYATFVMEGYETVPYHILFVSFAAVYGFRVWSLGVTVFALLAIVASTGIIFFVHWQHDQLPADELFEIGLMPLILGAMVWHARRRVAAQQEVERMAGRERERRLHEHELARDTSHALRTPLTIARGHIDLIREADVSAQVESDAEVALHELDRIGRMASRLLAIAELERPDTLNLQPVDVAALVRDTHARWSVAVQRTWSLEAPRSVTVVADEDVLRIVLDALIENAVAVTTGDDTVQLICRVVQDAVLVGVGDSGPGIDAADAESVFQRFWRSATKREGTGLGLSYVRAAMTAHGGSATVTRSTVGGAFVGCTLPWGGSPAVPSVAARTDVPAFL
jgi:signal transduction histidine kinase